VREHKITVVHGPGTALTINLVLEYMKQQNNKSY